MARNTHARPNTFRRFVDSEASGGIVLMAAAALALIAITSSNGGLFGQPDATAQQQTVDVIVHTRLAATAQTRATQTAENELEVTAEAVPTAQ